MATNNKVVGEINCPFCMDTADVKENAKGKFYIWCKEDGIIQPTKPNFQEYIRENAIFFNDDAENEAEKEKEKVEAEANEVVEEEWL